MSDAEVGTRFGTITVTRHYDGSRVWLEVNQADDLIQVTAELAAEQGIGKEGGRFTVTEDLAYDLTDWVHFPEGGRYADTFIGRKVQP